MKANEKYLTELSGLGLRIYQAKLEKRMTIVEICNACNFKEPIWYRLIRLTDNDYSGVTANNLKKVCELLKVKY
jgi:hypothetical protein